MHQVHAHIPYLSHGFNTMSYIFPAVANGAGSQGNQMQNNMQTCQITCYIMLNVKSTEGCGTGTIDRPLTSQKVGGYVEF